jgi:hypothetical protein
MEPTCGSIDSMINLRKRWVKNGQEVYVYHLFKLIDTVRSQQGV